jgi:NAD(P)-dependent dehydrogenase (short-subunit alcohol dehydrogenase family)
MTRTAVITGGSRGLGKSMAEHLAVRGTDVVLTYHSRKDEADKVVAAIAAHGRRAAALQLDVTELDSFDEFAATLESTLRDWGLQQFDYLINNAGTGIRAPIAETTRQQFDQMVAIHLKAPFFLTQALLPAIRDGGRILNVSSGLTRFSNPGFSAYAMVKGGIEVFTRYLAKELGERGIRANTIAPGAIETDFDGGMVRDMKELNKAIAAQTPLGRVGLPDDIGGAVAALLDDENGWMNAQRIEVSGGILL